MLILIKWSPGLVTSGVTGRINVVFADEHGQAKKEDCFHLVFWGLAAGAQCVGGFFYF